MKTHVKKYNTLSPPLLLCATVYHALRVCFLGWIPKRDIDEGQWWMACDSDSSCKESIPIGKSLVVWVVLI